jgi:hypothetical protein
MEIQKAPLRSSGSFFTWSRTLPSTIIVYCRLRCLPRRAVPGCAGLDVPPEGNHILAATPPPLNSTYEQVFCLNEKQRFQFELGTNKVMYLGGTFLLSETVAHTPRSCGQSLSYSPKSSKENCTEMACQAVARRKPSTGRSRSLIRRWPITL